MTEAEKLLAEWVRHTPSTDLIGGFVTCPYCRLNIDYHTQEGEGPLLEPYRHDEGCVWRRAKEYLEGICQS